MTKKKGNLILICFVLLLNNNIIILGDVKNIFRLLIKFSKICITSNYFLGDFGLVIPQRSEDTVEDIKLRLEPAPPDP